MVQKFRPPENFAQLWFPLWFSQVHGSTWKIIKKIQSRSLCRILPSSMLGTLSKMKVYMMFPGTFQGMSFGVVVKKANYKEEVGLSNPNPSILIPILFFWKTTLMFVLGVGSALGGLPLNLRTVGIKFGLGHWYIYIKWRCGLVVCHHMGPAHVGRAGSIPAGSTLIWWYIW